MNRKQFLKKAALSLGAAAGLPVIMGISECGNESKQPVSGTSGPCDRSPEETAGPFPNHDSNSLVKTNIALDRQGVAMTMTLTVVSQKDGCKPLPSVFVDVWHCDAHGAYSEYGGMRMQEADHKHEHFCRGRQTTDANGQVTFQSIYPGWYPGRAPHIHVEVLDKNENSLVVSQIAFPEDVNSAVYANTNYRGKADTGNDDDDIFSDSLDQNMADALTGDAQKGYLLLKTLTV
jgi:protocatechuate 3,4-dioxygenase beta subunit